MKKVILSLIILVACVQISSAQAKLRLEAGANAFNVTGSTKTLTYEGKPKIGIRAALAVEVPLLSILYVAPGVAYRSGESQDGKNNAVAPGTALEGVLSNKSVFIPVNLGLRLKLLNKLAISVEAGPYASFSIEDKYTVGGVTQSIGEIYKKIGKDYNAKQFNYGIGVSGAVEFNKLYVRVGYDYDMGDKFTYNFKELPGYSDGKLRNVNIYATLGLRF